VHETLDTIRWVLLAILIVGLVGTATELLLLGHDEEALQLVPLALIVVAFLAIAWHALDQGSASLRLFQTVMVLFILAGVLGICLHYRANVEFQREVDPSISGRALIVKALTAKAPPALAPGAMSQLGLIGLVYAYRYPSRRRTSG
jgi:hypothetical protein